jgi:hypothetical protein
MKRKNELVVSDSLDDNNKVETFELFCKNGLCDQLIEKIMSIPEEMRNQFQYSIAAQGAGVKIPRSDFGDIEVTPPKVLLTINPLKSTLQ